MFINYKYISLYINTEYFDNTKIPVLFFHGFSGSSKDWKYILPKIDKKFSPIALDFIGHGKSASPFDEQHYNVNELVNHIHYVIRHLKLKDPVLVGYSMGGRAALSFTVHHPNVPQALILESSTPGIEKPADLIERIDNDLELARNINKFGIEWFVNHWIKMPLFESQQSLPQEKLTEIIEDKLQRNSTGLINSLRAFGTGKMPSLWNNLPNIRHKTLLITGQLDRKFSEINKNVNNYLHSSEHKIISDAGHNTHLEKPEEFTILVNNFLKSLQ